MEAQAGSRHLEILLLHELSAGTFARLYLAEARAPGGLERIVAVKILREQWNESAEVINRTRDEARLLARLRHKNILRVEDLTEIDGQLAIIMEFVDGVDLKQLVEALAKRGQKVPARAALQIAAEAASALEAAYFKVPYGLDAPLHVVHRDIKPSNVMVSVEGELKVLDFGTARSSHAFRSVQTGALRFGSLKYMSPERREGDRGEHAADVYALGLMLLEILKGEWLPLLPMDVQEHDETVTEEVGRLGALGMPNREWDIALRQVLLQMLAGDASQRPNAEQVARLLRAFADQAAGDTLDTFARDVVAPVARQLRGNLTGGALAGTRFVLNVGSDGSAKGAAPRAPEPPRPPVPAPSRSVHSVSVEEDEPPTRLDLNPVRPVAPASKPAVSPSPTWPPGGVSAPFPKTNASGRDAGRSSASVATAAEAAPAPEPPRKPRPTVEVSHPSFSPSPPPPAKSGGGGMAIAAGGLVVVLALACAGILGAGGLWFFLSAEPAPTVAQPSGGPASGASGGGAASLATGSAAVSVTMDGLPVQWIRVSTSGGEQVLSGQGRLDGKVAEGAYELSLKQVGRPVLKGALQVPGAGISLVCRAGKDNTVDCGGGGGTVTLRP